MKHPLTAEEKLAPDSLQRISPHGSQCCWPQGIDKTIARLSDFTYWVSIAKDAGYHCDTCQMVKAPARPPASLQPIVTNRPWEIVGMDILKVPMSSKRKSAFSHGTGLLFQMALCNCTSRPESSYVRTIVRVLRDPVFTMVGPPRRLHLDQGRNFESHILSELCKAFKVEKSHTTPYHPMAMGDGLVKQMNRSLLSLLRTLTERQYDREDYQQLLLFAYQTSQHSITKSYPYDELFGWNPPSLQLPLPSTSIPPDPGDYGCQLQYNKH